MTHLWVVRILRIKKLGNFIKAAPKVVASPTTQSDGVLCSAPNGSTAIGADSGTADAVIRVLLVRCYDELKLPETRRFFEMLLDEMTMTYWEDRNPLVEDDFVSNDDSDYSESFRGHVMSADVVMQCGENESAQIIDMGKVSLTDETPDALEDIKTANTFSLQCIYDIYLDPVGSELFCRVVAPVVEHMGATIMQSCSYDILQSDEWDIDIAHRIDYSCTTADDDDEMAVQFFMPNIISTRRRDALKAEVAQRWGCDMNDKTVFWCRVIEEFAQSRITTADAVLLFTWNLCESTDWNEREKMCVGQSTAFVSILSLNPYYCRAHVLRDALNLELEFVFDKMEETFPEEEHSDIPVPASWTAERISEMESVMTRLLHLEFAGKNEQERVGVHVALRIREAKSAAWLSNAWKESGIFVQKEPPGFHAWKVDCLASGDAVQRAFDALHRAWGGLF